jgi:hypothetical protein
MQMNEILPVLKIKLLDFFEVSLERGGTFLSFIKHREESMIQGLLCGYSFGWVTFEHFNE